MTASLPRVAMLVVAFGHADELPRTLTALQALDYPADLRELLLVENSDGSSARVARGLDGVTVLEPGRNLGFAGGNNLAAAATTADVLVLINPDVQPRRSFLRAIVAPLGDPEVGAVGAKLLFPDEQTVQHAGGFLQQPLALAQHHGYGETDHGQWDAPADVEFVTGAALAIRRATWLAHAGLDAAFFPGYFEEADLCLRLRAAGLKVRYQPSAVAIHREGPVLGTRSADYQRLYHRNRLRLLFKHHPDSWLGRVWLPAELAHLRSIGSDAELAGLHDAYRWWQITFAEGAEPDELPPAEERDGELMWTLRQVAAKQQVAPLAFRSRLPLVARIRTALNRLSTESYLRPLLQQQNDFNASVVELAQALERQRRSADAAILCQGLLLAKLLRHAHD